MAAKMRVSAWHDRASALAEITFAEGKAETWDAVMDLNIKTIFFMIQAFLPFLRAGASPEDPRNVINIASIDGCGKINSFYNYAYGATKAGLIQLGRHLGDSLAWEGVHINTISPGDFFSSTNWAMRPFPSAILFARTSPFSVWSAWDRLSSGDRSHSQTLARRGFAKVLRK